MLSFAKMFRHQVFVWSWERKVLVRNTLLFMSHLHQKTKQHIKRLNNILSKMWYRVFLGILQFSLSLFLSNAFHSGNSF